jgi:hypothetical protein
MTANSEAENATIASQRIIGNYSGFVSSAPRHKTQIWKYRVVQLYNLNQAYASYPRIALFAHDFPHRASGNGFQNRVFEECLIR